MSASCHSLPGDWCQPKEHLRETGRNLVKYNCCFPKLKCPTMLQHATTQHLMLRCHGHLRYVRTSKPQAAQAPIRPYPLQRVALRIHPGRTSNLSSTTQPLSLMLATCNGNKSQPNNTKYKPNTKENCDPSEVLGKDLEIGNIFERKRGKDLETSLKENVQPVQPVQPGSKCQNLLCSLH